MEGSINGELTQNAITGPSGTPLASIAAIRGITPHEHKGMVAPTIAAPAMAIFSLRLNTALIRFAKPDTVTQAEIPTLNRKKGKIDQTFLPTKAIFDNTLRQKTSGFKPDTMPVLKTKMVIPASPTNPQIQKAVDFVTMEDVAVPAASALSVMAGSPEELPQQDFPDDSLTGMVPIICRPGVDPQQPAASLAF
jgi:hypothetical protein